MAMSMRFGRLWIWPELDSSYDAADVGQGQVAIDEEISSEGKKPYACQGIPRRRKHFTAAVRRHYRQEEWDREKKRDNRHRREKGQIEQRCRQRESRGQGERCFLVRSVAVQGTGRVHHEGTSFEEQWFEVFMIVRIFISCQCGFQTMICRSRYLVGRESVRKSASISVAVVNVNNY